MTTALWIIIGVGVGVLLMSVIKISITRSGMTDQDITRLARAQSIEHYKPRRKTADRAAFVIVLVGALAFIGLLAIAG